MVSRRGSSGPLTGDPEALAKSLRDYAAELDHLQLWVEPNMVAGYEACGWMLELADQD